MIWLSRLSRRLAPLAIVAAASIGPVALAADDPLFDAYSDCVTEQLAGKCLARASVEVYQAAVDGECGIARNAYAGSKAAALIAEKHLTPERAATEAKRQISRVETAMVGEYRKCLGEPR